MSVGSTLGTWASSNAAPTAALWLDAKLSRPTASAFAGAFAGARRRFAHPSQLGGTEAGAEHLSQQEQADLEALGARTWSPALLARSALLLAHVARLPPEEQLELVTSAFRKGDNSEREAVLKTLALLPNPEHFIPLATEACRTHVQSVFEAVACDNPFPARFLPAEAFNQMVLKAVFTEAPLGRLVGLSGRATAELRRMALAYASERRAAGRAISDDLEALTHVGCS